MVVGTDPIDGDDRGGWVGVSKEAHQMSKRIRARPRCKRILKWLARLLERLGGLLRECACDQPPEKVARRYPAHAPVWLSQGRQARQCEGLRDRRRELRAGKRRRRCIEQVGRRILVHYNLQMFVFRRPALLRCPVRPTAGWRTTLP